MHTWTRCDDWSEEADAALGELIKSDREGVLDMIAAGLAQLFRVDGPVYGGWFLIRFVDGGKGLECHCIAFNGRNTAGGLGDLWRLVSKAGAVALTCTTEQEAVARLYKRQGWKIEEFCLRYEP